MSSTALNIPLIKSMVRKDWQLYEKQMAAVVAGGILSLCLLGMAKSWSFYLGSLLLIIVLVCAACFSVGNSMMAERREKTLAFVMSLPLSPLDFYLSKMVGNLITFFVPLLVIGIGTYGVILFTPLPDGLLVLATLLFAYITLAFCVSLSVAMSVESEGLNTFAMVASMVMINPFLMGLGQIPAIAEHHGDAHAVWSWQALTILGCCLLLGLLILLFTGWMHCRKKSFY